MKDLEHIRFFLVPMSTNNLLPPIYSSRIFSVYQEEQENNINISPFEPVTVVC
jgi:hypothetical protein